MRVIPLGTSSGRPTRQRNVSALAVDLGPRWILVDCGEATQHQVARSVLRPSRLELVLITHLHGDHVLGLPGLLSSAGLEARTDPLPIVGPRGLGGWLDAAAALPILTLPFDVEVTELDDHTMEGSGQVPAEVASVAGTTVSALALRHRVPTFGYRISEPARPGRLDVERARALGVTSGPDLGALQRGRTVRGDLGDVDPAAVVGPLRPGRVVTVLGDTTPCAASVRLARGADLLVHEATYADADGALAERWRHSTAAQAAAVARDAAAARLLITHFSARYPDETRLVDEARAVFAATEAAVELAPVDVPGD